MTDTNDRLRRIKGLPLTELSITGIACIVDVYEDDNGNEKPVVEMEVLNEADWEKFNAPKEEACRCAMCGHKLKIACAVTHQPSGNGYWIGRDCASTITALQKFGTVIKGATVALAQRLACDKRESDFMAAHPEAIGVITWSKRPASPRISRDICEKLRRFGNISDKQIALLEKIRQQDIDRRSKATGKAEKGRQVIKGTVIKVVVEESEFGNKWHTPTYARVTVKLDTGVVLNGKLPEHMVFDERTVVRGEPWEKAGYETDCYKVVKKGDVIELKATVEQSKNDELFGFWKRPADFRIVELAPPPPPPPVPAPVAPEAAPVAVQNALLSEFLRLRQEAEKLPEPERVAFINKGLTDFCLNNNLTPHNPPTPATV